MRNVLVALVVVLMSAAFVAVIYFSREGSQQESNEESGPAAKARPLRVVATTGMVADQVKRVGGTLVEVSSLMGPGIDPHLYKASESDVRKMAEADVIFYTGLHLEGKLTEVFEQMASRGIPTVAIAEGLPKSKLLKSDEEGGLHDPHIWFDVSLWSQTLPVVADELSRLRPDYADLISARVQMVQEEYGTLHQWVARTIESIPEERRVLITAHDAFGYFARAYGIEVQAVQGVSTATEAGAGDIQRLAEFIASRQIPAIFVESSVPPAVIRALQAAVRSRGHDVTVGGELFSDAMGPEGSGADNYVGMVKHNARTIASSLSGR